MQYFKNKENIAFFDGKNVVIFNNYIYNIGRERGMKMYNNSTHDIRIDKNIKTKSRKPILAVLIIIILLAAIAYGVYYYFTLKNKETNKELFLKGLTNANLKFFLEDETYSGIGEKFSNNSFESNSDITFSTNIENEDNIETEVTDYTKYLLKWKTINKKETQETYNEFDISYSDNKFFDFKVINNKDITVLKSTDIVNRYVGIHKENTNSFFDRLGIKTEILDEYNNFKNQFSFEKIELPDEEKNLKLNDYKNIMLSKLTEEKFTKQENQISLVKANNEEVSVEAYKLKLSSEEYNSIVEELLSTLKFEEELLEKLITNTPRKIEEVQESENNNQNSIITIPLPVQTDEMQSLINPTETTKGEASELINNLIDSVLENKDTEKDNDSLTIKEFLFNIFLGRKTNCSLEEAKTLIDDTIKSLEKNKNNFELTIYVSELATEKISIVFPDETTIDLEFININDNKKELICTYLYKENLIEYNEEDTAIYSASTENNILEEGSDFASEKTNGIKLDISKSKNDASTNLKIVANIIENKTINEKIILDLITKGVASSKNYNNDCTLTYSDNNGEVKINIKNKISFDKISEIEELNEENCLYLDDLNDAEFTLTVAALTSQTKNVIESKISNLSFIDTNTKAPVITQNQNREELKNLLISTVSNQMGEALNNGQEYTIYNLQNLQISGHIVNVFIENDIATVSVDGVKFKIDSNFNLTDAE